MTPQFRPTDQGSVLTVFGFGMNGAVFWAVFRNQHRTEQVWTALQLGTNPSAKVCYLVRRAYNLGHGPVRFASVPRRKEEKRGASAVLRASRRSREATVLVTSLLFILPQAIIKICSVAFPNKKGLKPVFQWHNLVRQDMWGQLKSVRWSISLYPLILNPEWRALSRTIY